MTARVCPAKPAVSAYHTVRFSYDPRREPVWRSLCAYLQRWVDPEQGVLELGAGYGEFSNFIRARKKWALDVNPDLIKRWDPSIAPLIQSALEPWALEDQSVGTVFASNFFEHFLQEESGSILSEASRVLRPGGRLVVVQPNFRLEPRRYFDDYTHKAIFTENSFCDFLSAHGWRVAHCEGRFTPFTMKSSHLPTAEWLVRLYLALPYRPFAGQFLVVAQRPEAVRGDDRVAR